LSVAELCLELPSPWSTEARGDELSLFGHWTIRSQAGLAILRMGRHETFKVEAVSRRFYLFDGDLAELSLI
jgi:hypothetical protein